MSTLPEWIKRLQDVDHDPTGAEIERILKGLAIAWEALGFMSSWPNNRIAEDAMRRITALGGDTSKASIEELGE